MQGHPSNNCQLKFYEAALEFIRYGTSSRAGSAIINAIIKDMKVVIRDEYQPCIQDLMTDQAKVER